MSQNNPDRFVGYVIEKGSFQDGDYSWSPAGVTSSEIHRVPDRRLRVALQLADIVQALEFPAPAAGRYPGGVVAVPAPPRRCVVARPGELSAVYTDFPDDTMLRLEEWHNKSEEEV